MRPSRKALRVLTLLTFAGGAALVALGVHVALVAHLAASAAALASIGFAVVLLSLVGFVGAGRDKSALLMAYFFANFAVLTALFVASYAALAFQDSLVAWLKRHWAAPVLSYLRTRACCRDGFEATAQYVKDQFLALGLLGLASLALVLLAMYCVVRIVTVPIVMKSLLTVLNAVFFALGAALVVYGAAVKSRGELTAGQQWIAVVFLVAGTLLAALAGVGIVGARAKSRTMLLLYIVGIGACLAALLVCAGAAFSFSDKLARDYGSQAHTEEIACDIALPGCSNCTAASACAGVTEDKAFGAWYACKPSASPSFACDKPGWTLLVAKPEDQGYTANDIAPCGRCPEWSRDDVHAYLKSGLQLLGLCAAIVCFFILVGFGAALILRRSLAGYQTDSI